MIPPFPRPFSSGDYDGHRKAFSLCLWEYSNADLGVFLGSLSTCRGHAIFKFRFFSNDSLLFASRICWNSIKSIIASTHEVFPIPLAATQSQIMMDHSRTGVLFIECCAFSPPNIPSFSLQPKSSSSSLYRTCSQNASGLTGWASASFWCRILWPECSRGLLLRSLHGMKATFVQVWLDSVSLLCLPHLPGGLLQPNRVLTCYCSCPTSNFLFSSSCLTSTDFF